MLKLWQETTQRKVGVITSKLLAEENLATLSGLTKEAKENEVVGPLAAEEFCSSIVSVVGENIPQSLKSDVSGDSFNVIYS